MLKLLADAVFSFDVEWIPDPKSGEILHQTEACQRTRCTRQRFLLKHYGVLLEKTGDPDDYKPYLKTILCRIVSLAGILREKVPGGAELKLISLPIDPNEPAKCEEKAIISYIFKICGSKKTSTCRV